MGAPGLVAIVANAVPGRAMSDKFQPIPMESLAAWVFGELEASGSIFGIPRELFFTPRARDPFATEVYGRRLETPFGVAAGPHSQMAQNIVAAWLCGARFIELKTVQTLDELDVSKPCIDLQDEGYNCEWSQELKVRQSFDEYLRAWVLIHALHRQLGFPGDAPGMVFNVSVGYNLEGLLQPNMQEYLRLVGDAGDLRAQYVGLIARYVPGLQVPARLSDNVTLSTMHGCPPGEIEKIAAYLVEEWGFHTNVKLNPTLLGPGRLREILNERLGYADTVVPDLAFEHDLKYADAVPMLRRLQAVAKKRKVQFGVKLSNTLEVENRRDVFPKKEKMMYLSGRALHAVTVNLAAKLSAEFGGGLMMSFSAGADAFNAPRLLACGMKTVTVCSDILKTGGYLRLPQYLENTAAAMKKARAKNLPAFAKDAPASLAAYADEVLEDRRYRKETFDTSRTKTVRPLGLFDCIKAPCTDECPVNQKVPQYMGLVREGRFDDAVEVVRQDNPLGAILGRACNHLCEQVCVRTHLDEPLAIREMKRFIMDREKRPHYRKRGAERAEKVAVIGGGPCGLSTTFFLRQAGFPVTVFEARPYAGGMVSGSIPGYRATRAVIEQDMKIIRDLGADIRYGQKAGRDFTIASLRKQGFKHIVVAAGAQKGVALGIPGEDSAGVLDGLEFLRAAREEKFPNLGKNVAVIGGGDVAMDCARTAKRLSGGKVTIVYRRTRHEMPAQREELQDALAEGVEMLELAAPKAVVAKDGELVALRCARMKLGDPDESGRRRPVEIQNSEFDLPLDSLIVAIGQRPDFDFLAGEKVEFARGGYIRVDPATMETSVPGLYAGGDAVMNGPESIVKALGDGRKIAERIQGVAADMPGSASPATTEISETVDVVDLARRRSHRQYRVDIPHVPPAGRKGFEEVTRTLSETAARAEAARCLDCHLLCSICARVCPNLAIQTYRSVPMDVAAPVLKSRKGKCETVARRPFRVGQLYQVLVLTDFCNECGNCATFCPTAGKPYRDKPRLYLQRPEFEAESDNAFRVFRREGILSIEGRFGGETHELVAGRELIYSTPKLRAKLDAATLNVKQALTCACGEGDEISLEPAAVMYSLLKSFSAFLSFLPTAG